MFHITIKESHWVKVIQVMSGGADCRAGFLRLSIIDVLGWRDPCEEDRLVHYRMFGGIPGFCPLHASCKLPFAPSCDKLKCLQLPLYVLGLRVSPVDLGHFFFFFTAGKSHFA